MEKIEVRKKHEILDTLEGAINDSDRRTAKAIYVCAGSVLKNKFKTKDNPASFIGWARHESGDLLRIEAEPREVGGQINLSLKIITVPNAQAVELGLDEAQVPAYTSVPREVLDPDDQRNFITQ